jgi:hypothetical protein
MSTVAWFGSLVVIPNVAVLAPVDVGNREIVNVPVWPGRTLDIVPGAENSAVPDNNEMLPM